MSYIRPPMFQGIYYPLSPQLDRHLQDVLTRAYSRVRKQRQVRLVVAPYSELQYCGDTLAYSYAAIDSMQIKRVIILAQHSKSETYQTPFDSWMIPLEISVAKFTKFKNIPELSEDEDLHCPQIEMQLLFLQQILQLNQITLQALYVGTNLDISEAEVDENTLIIVCQEFNRYGVAYEFTPKMRRPEYNQIFQRNIEVVKAFNRSDLLSQVLPLCCFEYMNNLFLPAILHSQFNLDLHYQLIFQQLNNSFSQPLNNVVSFCSIVAFDQGKIGASDLWRIDQEVNVEEILRWAGIEYHGGC